MRKEFFDLQMFADEADTGSATGSMEASQGTEESTGDASQTATDEGTERPSFEDLIKGEYKADYDKAVQGVISKRFKNQKDSTEKLNQLHPLIGMIAGRYGINPGEDGTYDIEAIQQAITDDNAMYEDEAFKRGMDVDTLKQMKKLELENQNLRRQTQQSAQEEQARREYEALLQQGEEVKKVYPNFDLNQEMQNPTFGRMAALGTIPLQTIYEVIHHDEIMQQGMQYAVQNTAKKISNSIASGKRRPAENGAANTSPTSETGQQDPSKLTRDEIEKIKERAARGERITFR